MTCTYCNGTQYAKVPGGVAPCNACEAGLGRIPRLLGGGSLGTGVLEAENKRLREHLVTYEGAQAQRGLSTYAFNEYGGDARLLGEDIDA